MELRRFFVNKEDIVGTEIRVRGEEFEHMTRVLRMKPGYKVIVCADDGVERYCVIRSVDGGEAVLDTENEVRVDSKSVSLTLFAGLLKNAKLDLVVQKAVELGVDVVVPFVSENTVEKKFNAARACRIALEAAKQCGSPWLSRVEDAVTFRDVLSRVKEFDTVCFAYEKEKSVTVSDAAGRGAGKVALIVGSEGGFTPEEAEAAVRAGARSVTLGRRVLRAETADIVGCALLLNALGELDHER